MAEMTVEQRKALAMASARLRLQQSETPYDPAAEMSTGGRFLAGVGKGMTDIVRGAGQLVGLGPSFADTAAQRQLDAPLMNTGAGQVGNIVGNLAVALPAAVIPGANTVTGGAAIGAGLGLLQPSTSFGEKARGAAIGAVAGAALPVATKGYRIGKSLVEPLYERGREQIVGRALNRAAGSEAPNVRSALQNATTLVPGSEPTVAEVANNANIAALQRTASALSPQEYAARAAKQNDARVQSLLDMAGSGGQRDFYDAARRQAANDLYQRAYEKGVDITRDPLTGQFLQKNVISGVKGEITKLLKRPAIKEAVKEARTLAANEGVNLTNPSGSVKGLDYVKRALDDKISATTPGSNQARVLTDLKNRLLTTLDKLSPDYAQARTTFAEMSKPINQMDIAQEIADKSINKLTGVLQPQAYARALQDRTAQSATGFNRATIEGVMAPDQLGLLNNIKSDLARSVAARDLGRGAGSDTVQKLAQTNILEQAGVPTFLRNLSPLQIVGNLASRGASAVYNDANQKIAERLAMSLLTPADAARLMVGATPTPMGKTIANAFRIPLQGGLLSLPSSMNGQQ